MNGLSLIPKGKSHKYQLAFGEFRTSNSFREDRKTVLDEIIKLRDDSSANTIKTVTPWTLSLPNRINTGFWKTDTVSRRWDVHLTS